MSHCHHKRVHCIASTKSLQEDMNVADMCIFDGRWLIGISMHLFSNKYSVSIQ